MCILETVILIQLLIFLSSLFQTTECLVNTTHYLVWLGPRTILLCIILYAVVTLSVEKNVFRLQVAVDDAV